MDIFSYIFSLNFPLQTTQINIRMESYYVTTSIDIPETGRQNEILAIRAHLEIIESVPLGSPPYSDEESD